MKKPRHFGQKLSLVSAYLCALLAAPTLGYLIWVTVNDGTRGMNFAVALPVFLFLASVAGVCYAMSLPGHELTPMDMDQPEK